MTNCTIAKSFFIDELLRHASANGVLHHEAVLGEEAPLVGDITRSFYFYEDIPLRDRFRAWLRSWCTDDVVAAVSQRIQLSVDITRPLSKNAFIAMVKYVPLSVVVPHMPEDTPDVGMFLGGSIINNYSAHW